eukprot:2262913-Karenia_brevis.AAC.1
MKALDEEWNKLAKLDTWSLGTVREKDDAENEADLKNEETHFGEVMSLCSLKGDELDVKHQKDKGRVVFRGDKVKINMIILRFFSEQGTSASHMAAPNFLSALGRTPG